MKTSSKELCCPHCGSSCLRYYESVPRSVPMKRVAARSWRVLLNGDQRHYDDVKETQLLCGKCYREFPIPQDLELEFEF
jgi:hypothetical protein